MSSSSAADSPYDAQKLVSLPADQTRVTEELAVAVRDLGDAESIRANGCGSLIRKIRGLFPELMMLRGDHDASVALRDRQVTELAPYLLGTNTLDATRKAESKNPDRGTHANPLDEVARRMWEISVTEQLIERYRVQEQSLRDEILASVNPAHLPLIRWALNQA